MLTFGSLFAGIGGLDLGLERAGMKCLWQVEIDEFCQRVLAKHWPDVERFGDVRDCGKHNLAPVDLVCGGFPCQPVSCAGKRQGESDERWLWPEFARVVCELKPRWVLAENVPGLLSVDAGRVFGGILRDLAALGYDAEWDCVSAASVGAPHRRDRVFIVGHADSKRAKLGPPNRMEQFAFASAGAKVADDDGSGCSHIQGQRTSTEAYGRTIIRTDHRRPASEWSVEPDVGRVADGVPARVDRLRSLGNAVVPQVAEFVGRMITNCGVDSKSTNPPA